MASTDNEVPAPIIVKKIKKGGHGHHGGAWKVAYADFVTAMMAFFLLMWLLNVSTDEQKEAISNYFDPTNPKVSSSESGSGGVLGGMTVSPDGAMTSNTNPLTANNMQMTQSGNKLGDEPSKHNDEQREGNHQLNFSGMTEEEIALEAKKNGVNILDELEKAKEEELEKLREKIEQAQNETFETIKDNIYQEIRNTPDLAELEDHLLIDITPEGLRIQIIDEDGRSMFPSGKAAMFDFMRDLLVRVTKIIIPQPNQISVRGHTDGVLYPEGATYDNWNLSADRALASRSVMLEAGLSPARTENVLGRADREHLLPDEPLSPRNRRISIVLLRQALETEDQINNMAEEYGVEIQDEETASEDQSDLNQELIINEDRSDMPEMERTVDDNPEIAIPGTQDADTLNKESTIADEIRKLREQKQQRQNSAPVNRQPTITDDSQYLQF